MKETRSASQILFGFLPGQTVDLKSRVWKVKEWVEPRPRSIERQALRQELEKQLVPWAVSDRDGKYLDHLRRGYSVRLYSLNHETGVTVEKFPQNWVCQTCDRLYQGVQPNSCVCGSTRFGQLPFVGFHDECGAMRAPYVKACPQHKQIKFVRSGTARAEEIRFVCPIGESPAKGIWIQKL